MMASSRSAWNTWGTENGGNKWWDREGKGWEREREVYRKGGEERGRASNTVTLESTATAVNTTSSLRTPQPQSQQIP